MEFKTDQWGGARLVVPDEPTLFQVLDFDSKRYGAEGLPTILILWEMAKTLITEWECEVLPDKDISLVDMKAMTDRAHDAGKIIEWAGTIVSAYRRGLENVPKN